MKPLSEKLITPNLATLTPYESARRLFSGGQLWLNANESPFNHDYKMDSSELNRYPDCQPKALIQAYADYARVSSGQTLATRGADEGIELLIRTFCTPGQDSILICPPTYGMYAISAQTHNVGVEFAPLLPDFSLDLEAIRAYKNKVKLVFICSPNNPTGTQVAKDQLIKVLDYFADSAHVVVDEAYAEFSNDNWATALNQYPNLVVLRTLSKAFALAGLRCGFTLANADIIGCLMKVIAPYPIPAPVAQIASQALQPQAIARMRSEVSVLADEKRRLKAALAQIGDIEFIGGEQANFLLIRTQYKQPLMDYLVAQGVLIRDQSKQPGLDNCLRITIGSQEQNHMLTTLIQTFFTQQEQAS